MNVATGVACPWTPRSTAGWINDVSGAGPGSKDVSFNVQRNDGAARSGSVEVGGSAITISQSAPPAPTPTCSYGVDRTSVDVPRGGGKFVVQVKTSAGCGWVVAQPREQTWVSFDPAKGSGPGQVVVVVGDNATRKPRTAKIEVAGHGIAITQPAD